MPTVEIDMEAREILRSWKRRFAEQGRNQDYSEAIRSMNDMKNIKVDVKVSKEQEFKNAVKPIVENMMKTKVAKKK
jgi:hypothetical protein